MSETIRPALTAEEWAKASPWAEACRPWDIFEQVFGADGRARHAHAALCLHGQPFGFTHEDVRIIRIRESDCADPADADDFRSLADRIEALLPPESQRTPTPDSE